MYFNKKEKPFLAFAISIAGAVLLTLPAPALWAEENLTKQCLECHESEVKPTLTKSVHSDNECADCHTNFPLDEKADDPHGKKPPKPSCSNDCHTEVNDLFKKNAHGKKSKLFEFFGEHGDSHVTCSTCHGGHDIVSPTNPKSKTYGLINSWLSESVHDKLKCADCHYGENTNPDHKEFKCKNCHEKEGAEYAKSIHGEELKKGDKDSALCYDCHGSHHILKTKDEKSMVYPFNLPITCGVCHSNQKLTLKHNIDQPNAVNLYIDSMHGQGLMKMGLIVAPSCNDCHGVHNIQNHKHPDSPINHKNIPGTCGTCHKKIEQVYNTSVHGELLKKGDPKGPVCVDCHVSHNMGVLSKQGRMVESDKTCGKCHEEKLARYRETYHGKAMALGEGKVAACYDCHGTHDIYAHDDARSLIFRGTDKEGTEKDTLITTCQKCHPNAGPKFAGYATHADHMDSKKFPVLYWVYVSMTGLILGTFGFFGLHTITWLSRTLYFRFKDPVGFSQAKIKIKEDDETFTRFTPIDRFLHGLVIMSFLLLVITGMPIKFYETEWAKVMFTMLGGSQTARSLHRLGAFITGLYFAIHIIVVTRRTFAAWLKSRDQHDGKLTWKGLKDVILGPDSPIPNKQDWTDLVAHQKYFFGKGSRPQFDRWTYWEKFDYWAVFWGVGVIGLSGLVMWAPSFFTKLLPGIAINIALIVHSDEALLAAGFIFTFHFFNVHFRPEKFPIDSVIFSGRISRAEMEHERGRQLDRLTTEGSLDESRHKGDEWESWKKIMHPLGYLAFGIGLVLIVMIYVAMGTRLLSN